MSLVNDYQSK